MWVEALTTRAPKSRFMIKPLFPAAGRLDCDGMRGEPVLWIFLFVLVPISEMEHACREITPAPRAAHRGARRLFGEGAPGQRHAALLPSEQQVVATHPCLARIRRQNSDSKGKRSSFRPLRVEEREATILEKLFHSMGLGIIYTTPEDHDRRWHVRSH